LTPFTAEQLTGRTRSHVVPLEAALAGPTPVSLHPEAAQALRALHDAAALAGMDLAVVSGFRDFARQCDIWNAKFTGARPLLDRAGAVLDVRTMQGPAIVEAILAWSALPGASRHHWGTDVDVIDRAAPPVDAPVRLEPDEYATGGRFARLHAWLLQHSERYGFYHPYDQPRGGVQPEPWHLSYAPLAHAALAALTLEVLQSALESCELAGRELVYAQLPSIHARYVRAVAMPSAVALAAAAAQSCSQAFLK